MMFKKNNMESYHVVLRIRIKIGGRGWRAEGFELQYSHLNLDSGMNVCTMLLTRLTMVGCDV